jgi:hypothetical protein
VLLLIVGVCCPTATSSLTQNLAKTGNSPQKTFDPTAREFVEVGLRSDEDSTIPRIYRWKPIPYDEEQVSIAWAKRNAAGSKMFNKQRHELKRPSMSMLLCAVVCFCVGTTNKARIYHQKQNSHCRSSPAW